MLFNWINRLLYPKKTKVFFTVNTGHQGFTDQMMQLSAYYRLGRLCGYEFYFTPFLSKRSEPLEGEDRENSQYKDIYDFLGITTFFSSQKKRIFESKNTFEVCLSDAILAKKGITSAPELVTYVQSVVSNHVEALDNIEPCLVILRMDRAKPAPGQGKRQFFSLIQSTPIASKGQLNFKAMYEAERSRHSNADLLEPSESKVVIHIRQGDTAAIKTPWNTFIPVDERRPDFLHEYSSLQQLNSSYHNRFVDAVFSPSDYHRFWEQLCKALKKSALPAQVFSDGYQRSLSIVCENSKRMQLTEQQTMLLNSKKCEYDSEAFTVFSDMTEITCHIGEHSRSLYHLVDSALKAQLIITGAQQRMLPKLVANYAHQGIPAVIVLYKHEEPDYSDVTSNHASRFIYVNILNPDFDSILKRLKDAGVTL